MFPRFMRRFSTTSTATTSSTGRAIRKLKDKRAIIQEQRQRNKDLQIQAEASKLDWRTVCSTYVTDYNHSYNLYSRYP